MTEKPDKSNPEKNVSETLPPAMAVVATVVKGEARESEKRFTDTFRIGRSSDCELQILETCVSRSHLRVILENGEWRLQDQGSANGSFMDGVRINELPLPDNATIELGKGGVLLSFTVERAELPKTEEIPDVAREFGTETQIISHYFDKKDDENIGEQTMMFRRAFARVHKKKSVKYRIMIGVAMLLLTATAAVAVYQHNKINKMRATAANIFYAMKSLELQVAKLEEVVLMQADPAQVAELRGKREKLKDMEREYDNFVKELGTYKNASEDERIILHVARVFGECDVNAPKGFVDEVRKYIDKWRKSDRLKTSLNRAREKGYAVLIPKILGDNEIPPQYFFLALQESNFDERAVGRQTRYGYAKGMWQFIPATASQYGLRTGPLSDQGVYDIYDERFDFVKSTGAAAKYIRDISCSQAQASGLLVMASYNWGEGNIRQIISKMPENPRDRNFWRLLEYKDIPDETYDYVFSIVSAAVICENPGAFGMDADCPVLNAKRTPSVNGN